jgi:heme A synthase
MSELLKKPADNDIGMSTVSARQAQSGMGVRYVLAISTFAAIAIMGIIYVLFFMS